MVNPPAYIASKQDNIGSNLSWTLPYGQSLLVADPRYIYDALLGIETVGRDRWGAWAAARIQANS